MTEPAPKTPEKKLWKKSAVRKGIGIALLLSAGAVFIGIPFGLVFLTDLILLIAFEIYGRVTGQLEAHHLDFDFMREGHERAQQTSNDLFWSRYYSHTLND